MKQDPDYDFENYEMQGTDSDSGSEYETNNPESSIDSLASDSEFDDTDSQGFRRLGADGDGQTQQSTYLVEQSKKRLIIKDGKIVVGAKPQRKVPGREGTASCRSRFQNCVFRANEGREREQQIRREEDAGGEDNPEFADSLPAGSAERR